jgi:hypothetical protein
VSVVVDLRRLAARSAPAPAARERCDLCGLDIPDDHRHLVNVEERRLACVCEPCGVLFPGDGPWRATGTRIVWLDELDLTPELWASFQIPIGLAFFFRTDGGGVAAFYPSFAGTTECRLDLEAWDELVERNAVLAGLEPEGEALLVDRRSEPPRHAIVPIDRCYRLVGLVKASWRGINGGDEVHRAIDGFFTELRG